MEEFVNNTYIHPIDYVEDTEFREIWKKIHALLPHLHPESILDNGGEMSTVAKRNVSFCLEPFFIRSGWPIELVPIAYEARKRYKSNRLASYDYFHA